jgi:hypothetical protein
MSSNPTCGLFRCRQRRPTIAIPEFSPIRNVQAIPCSKTKANLVYFARSAHAAGILEGLRHYGFLSDGEAPAVKEKEAAVGVS